MQSTGQASTQAVSLVPIQGSAIMYATMRCSFRTDTRGAISIPSGGACAPPLPHMHELWISDQSTLIIGAFWKLCQHWRLQSFLLQFVHNVATLQRSTREDS